MKILIIFLGTLFTLSAEAQTLNVSSCNEVLSNSSDKSQAIQLALGKLTQNHVPGAVAAMYHAGKINIWSSGYANIEGSINMQSCHLQYIQSISKTYMAVSILQLYEDGKIALDKSIINYLPDHISVYIPNAKNVTIKMLLSHTSGIPEYNYDPTYITRLLQNPEKVFKPAELLAYIKGKEPDFEPGVKHSYRNSNYLILALIAEEITGNHRIYMADKIFKPLGLANTYYQISPMDDYNQRLVSSYWDRYSNNRLENISTLQNSNVASLIGDDGIITTPEEAILFFKGLMEGKLLSNISLEMMKEWVPNQKGEPAYGLGLHYNKFAGVSAIGHSGGGLGSGSQLYYFPEKDLYLFLGINLGTVTESPIHKDAEYILEEIYRLVLD